MSSEPNLNELWIPLLEASPVLRKRYEDAIRHRYYGTSSPDDVLIRVLGHHLEDLLSSTTNEDELKEIFHLTEEILQRDGHPANDIFWLFESIAGGDDLRVLDRARQYMGEQGKRVAHEVLVINLFDLPTESDPAEIADYYWLGERLVEALPELRARYDELVEEFEDDIPDRPGQHVVFGDLLNPYLVKQLRRSGSDEVLRRTFALLEDMATHEGYFIRNVVEVTVCEYLTGNASELIPRAREFMGPHTEELCREHAIHMGHPFPDASGDI